MLLRSRILQAPSPVRRMIGAVLVLVSAPACDLFTAPGHDQTGVTVRWRFSGGGASGELYADSALVVFYPPSGTSVWAVDAATGSLRWHRDLTVPAVVPTGALPLRAPVVAGSVVVIPGWDLYGLDRASGTIRWTLRNDDLPAFETVLGDGAVFSAGIGRVYRVDPASGAVAWQTQVGEWSDTIVERPFAPVYGDGVVYVVTAVIGIGAYTVPLGRRIGHVVALSATSGATLWRFEIPEAPPFNGGAVGPGVVAGDVLIVGADNGRVYGLDRATGTPRWVHQGSQPYEAGAVIVDGVAITGNLDGHVEGFDPATGRLLWGTGFASSVSNRIARGEGVGLVSRGRLEAYDASGQERWGHGGAAWGGPVYLSAPASYGRLVYVGDPAALYALVPPQ